MKESLRMKKVTSMLIVMVMILGVSGCAYGEDPRGLGEKSMDSKEVMEELEPGSIDDERFIELTDELAEEIADQLNYLGLFKGTNKGYELDKGLTRAEGATLVSRLIEKEYKINSTKHKHPFKDVPNWANKSVAFMNERGIVKGISEDKYGSDNLMSAKDFTTIVLRILEYTGEHGFEWEDSLEKAVEVGLYSGQYKKELESRGFLRKDAVYIMKMTINSPWAGSPSNLVREMVSKGIIDKDKLGEVNEFLITGKLSEGELPEGTMYMENEGVLEANGKVFMNIDWKLYLIEDGKAIHLYKDKVVDSVVAHEGNLYMVMMDGDSEDIYNTVNTGIYKAPVDDLGNIKKLVDLDDENFYILRGLHGEDIYYYTITRHSYGVGRLFSEIERLNLKSMRKEVIAEDVRIWNHHMQGDVLGYTEGDPNGENKGLSIKLLSKGEVHNIDEDVGADYFCLGNKVLLYKTAGVYIYDLKTKSCTRLYSGINTDFELIHEGELYVKDEGYVKRVNLQTSEVTNIYKNSGLGEQEVSRFVVNGDNIYWLMNMGDLVYEIHESDLDGKNMRLVK